MDRYRRMALFCAFISGSSKAIGAQTYLMYGTRPIVIGSYYLSDADIRISAPYFTGLEYSSNGDSFVLKFYSDSFVVRESGLSYYEPCQRAPNRVTSYLTKHPTSEVLSSSQDASVIVVRMNGNYNDRIILQYVSRDKWKALGKIRNTGADFGLGYACLKDSRGQIWLLVPDSNEGRGSLLLLRFGKAGLQRLGVVSNIFVYSVHHVAFTTVQGKSYECK